MSYVANQISRDDRLDRNSLAERNITARSKSRSSQSSGANVGAVCPGLTECTWRSFHYFGEGGEVRAGGHKCIP